MTAGVFAREDAPKFSLMMGLARIFETLERMDESDQEAALEYVYFGPDGPPWAQHLAPAS